MGPTIHLLVLEAWGTKPVQGSGPRPSPEVRAAPQAYPALPTALPLLPAVLQGALVSVLSGRESNLDYWGNEKERLIIVSLFFFFSSAKSPFESPLCFGMGGEGLLCTAACRAEFPVPQQVWQKDRELQGAKSSSRLWELSWRASPLTLKCVPGWQAELRGWRKLAVVQSSREKGKEFHDTICNFYNPLWY